MRCSYVMVTSFLPCLTCQNAHVIRIVSYMYMCVCFSVQRTCCVAQQSPTYIRPVLIFVITSPFRVNPVPHLISHTALVSENTAICFADIYEERNQPFLCPSFLPFSFSLSPIVYLPVSVRLSFPLSHVALSSSPSSSRPPRPPSSSRLLLFFAFSPSRTG